MNEFSNEILRGKKKQITIFVINGQPYWTPKHFPLLCFQLCWSPWLLSASWQLWGTTASPSGWSTTGRISSLWSSWMTSLTGPSGWALPVQPLTWPCVEWSPWVVSSCLKRRSKCLSSPPSPHWIYSTDSYSKDGANDCLLSRNLPSRNDVTRELDQISCINHLNMTVST